MLKKRSIVFILTILILILTISYKVYAENDIVFYLEDEPVYCSDSKESPGFLLEIVLEMSKVLDIKPKLEFVPWNRAQ